MKLVPVIIAGVLAFLPTIACALEGYGEVVLDNKTANTLDLYVDDVYACRALGGGICPTQVRIGPHRLVAKRIADGATMVQQTTVEQGVVSTFTITDQ